MAAKAVANVAAAATVAFLLFVMVGEMTKQAKYACNMYTCWLTIVAHNLCRARNAQLASHQPDSPISPTADDEDQSNLLASA